MYYFILWRGIRISRAIAPSKVDEFQLTVQRVAQAGLYDLLESSALGDVRNEHTRVSSTPTIPQLVPHDPRAIDFRNSLRTWYVDGNFPPGLPTDS